MDGITSVTMTHNGKSVTMTSKDAKDACDKLRTASGQDRKVTKIKYDGKKVNVCYEIEREGQDNDEFTVRCGELPSRDFVKALESMLQYAEDIIECEKGWLTDGGEVRGVSVSTTNDVMGAVITVLKKLSTANSPLVINTPHLPCEPYNEDDKNALIMPDGCASAIKNLIVEALAYVDGKRAQSSIPGITEDNAA